tara:strand:+ start:432 stop:1106 length:675 start_codon:yes stop_codon:yes gene_type:complete
MMTLKGPSFELSNNPDKLVFLLHGYGDSGENFIPLAQSLYDSECNINFYAPNAPAPVPQYPSGKQWFELYPNGINFNDAGPKEKKLLKQDCVSSLKLIRNYIINLCLKYNLTLHDCFIIGFSQGAMMSFEFGKFVNEHLAGCILLSGRILPSENHDKKNFNKTPILIIHGDQDEVLVPKYFFEACDILKNHNFSFESHLIKNEGHTISKEILNLSKEFIKKNMT